GSVVVESKTISFKSADANSMNDEESNDALGGFGSVDGGGDPLDAFAVAPAGEDDPLDALDAMRKIPSMNTPPPPAPKAAAGGAKIDPMEALKKSAQASQAAAAAAAPKPVTPPPPPPKIVPRAAPAPAPEPAGPRDGVV